MAISWRLISFALLATLLLPWNSKAQEELRLTGQEVAIYNLAGRVEVMEGSGSDVVVQVMRGGDDGQRLNLDVTRKDGREALVIQYPGDPVIYPEMGRGSRTHIQVRSDGTFGGGGGDRVEIRGSGRGLEAWADLRVRVPRGRDLALFLAVGDAEASGVVGNLLMDTGSGEVTARRIEGALEIDTGSGRVTVEDVQGDLLIDTGSGELEVSNVRGTRVRLDTGSGEVVARGITASAVEIDSGSGSVSLSGISAPEIHVDTGSGEVEMELLEDVDDLVVDTGSGGVTLRLPQGIGARVEVDTGSGGIEVDLPLQIREVERNNLQGTLGDGRGRIRIDTGSGTVRLLSR